MRVAVQLTGAQELDAVLSLLPDAAARRAVIRALRRGARPLVREARKRVPKGKPGEGWRWKKGGTSAVTGPLWQSIKARAVPGVTAEGVAVAVGPDRIHFYGDFVERGHDIVAGGRKNRNATASAAQWTARRRGRKKGQRYGTVVGRARAFKFLEGAFAATQQQIIDGMAAEFWASLHATAARFEKQAQSGKLSRSNARFLEGGGEL